MIQCFKQISWIKSLILKGSHL